MESSNEFGLKLVEAESIEIVTIVDNLSDLLLEDAPSTIRPRLGEGGAIPSDTLLAEHGLSLLIRLQAGETRTTCLLDFGYSQTAMIHNLDLLGIDGQEIDALALSHGHMDHFGSLLPFLDRVNRPLDLIAHPGVFLTPRLIKREDGETQTFPRLNREAIEAKGARLVLSAKPYLSEEGLWAATGQVARTTGFEKGLAGAFFERDGKLVPDDILDDISLVMALKDKGLVIITGCAHAGIINTIRHCQQITGRQRVHAVIGGFHLSGKSQKPVIGPTIEELLAVSPQVIAPMHCTGWTAINLIQEAFGQRQILNSVGTSIVL